MWRYLPVLKVSSDKNTASPWEYEKAKTRKFLPKWQVHCPWLQNDWGVKTDLGECNLKVTRPA